MEAIHLLIIDDEQVIREGVQRALSGRGYAIDTAENGEQGLAMIQEGQYGIVLLDLMMPGIDGFTVLDWIKTHRPKIQVIVITGFATVSKAVTAMKQGAFDFVGKPFTPDYIRIVVGRAVEKIELEQEAERLREEQTLNLAAIDQEQSRLKTVFSCMAEAVLITDTQAMVVHHNPAAIKILEIQTDPVIGKPLASSLKDTTLVDMVHEAMDKNVILSREVPPGGLSRRFLRVHCAPVHSDRGQTIGSVTAFEDITTIKDIDRMKSEFVAMVAHELKAPLASIEQMIYALQVSCPIEGEKACNRLHERMTIRTRDLLRMIDNLLNLSKMERGSVVFNLEPIEGHAIIDEVLEITRPQAEGKNIAISYTPCPEPWWFNVDYDHIRTAFMNIVSNAVKYTPEGGQIDITATVNGTLARVTIKDSGIGIEAQDLPHIFDRFFRVKGKATRHISGAGLGLSLVKEVVEAHQGDITVHSRPGQGTSFTLSFPTIAHSS